MTIFLNQANAGRPHPDTVAVIARHMAREAEVSANAAMAEMAEELAAARASVAATVGAKASDIAFAESCATGWSRAFHALRLRAGDRVLVSRHEWGGNVAELRQAEAERGVKVEVIPCDDSGAISVAALAEMLDGRVKLVVVTWLPANSGLINPAEEIGALCREAGIPLILDAAQAWGQMPVDVAKIGCDVLVAPGRKHMRGPKGTAVLYLSEGFRATHKPLILDGHNAHFGDARDWEAGENSPALRLGLGHAANRALQIGLAEIQAQVFARAAQLREGLRSIPGVTLRDLGARQSGLVTLTIDGLSAPQAAQRLAERGILASANGVQYTPLDMQARGLESVLRFSPDYQTSEADIAATCNAIEDLSKVTA